MSINKKTPEDEVRFAKICGLTVIKKKYFDESEDRYLWCSNLLLPQNLSKVAALANSFCARRNYRYKIEKESDIACKLSIFSTDNRENIIVTYGSGPAAVNLAIIRAINHVAQIETTASLKKEENPSLYIA